MAILKFRLRDISSRTQLAERLAVDVRTLDVVSLRDTCRNNGCCLPAALNNHGRCILCQQTWFPLELSANGDRAKNCRGHGLYGPQFMRQYGGNTTSPNNACCCGSALCEEIGYSHEGMMCLPTNPAECIEATKALGIPPERGQQIAKQIASRPKNYRVAPWHYSPRHRVRGAGGNWEIRKMTKYRDDGGCIFNYAPPNYSIQQFVDNEIPSFEYSRGGYDYDDKLPPWLKEMVTAQEPSQPQTAEISNPITPQKTRGTKAGKMTTPTRTPTTTPSSPRKRASPESLELDELKESLRLLEAKNQTAMEQIENERATIANKDQELDQMRTKLNNALDENAKLKSTIAIVDIRPDVELWGTDSEIKRWHELRILTANKHLSATDISEIVFLEN